MQKERDQIVSIQKNIQKVPEPDHNIPREEEEAVEQEMNQYIKEQDLSAEKQSSAALNN
jgi:hypothetical protein